MEKNSRHQFYDGPIHRGSRRLVFAMRSIVVRGAHVQARPKQDLPRISESGFLSQKHYRLRTDREFFGSRRFVLADVMMRSVVEYVANGRSPIRDLVLALDFTFFPLSFPF
jgi:hypothetical protein